MPISASGNDQHVVLGAAQRLNALAIAGGGFIDVLGHRRGAHETDGFHIGMLQQAVDGNAIALQHRKDAIGHARLLDEFRQIERHRRVAFRGFQKKGISARDGVSEHPHRHHRREVEWRNTRHHTQWLADLIYIHAAADLFGKAALQHLRNAAGKLNIFEAAGDFAHRVGHRLAVFESDQFGDPAAVGVDQFAQLEHRLGATREGRCPPAEKGLVRHCDGVVDIGDASQLNLRARLSGRGIPDGG